MRKLLTESTAISLFYHRDIPFWSAEVPLPHTIFDAGIGQKAKNTAFSKFKQLYVVMTLGQILEGREFTAEKT